MLLGVDAFASRSDADTHLLLSYDFGCDYFIMAHIESVRFCQRDLPSAAFDVFPDMRKNEELCDVTVKAGKYKFVAHRVILAASIPYFRSLFTSTGFVTDGEEIIIEDVDPTVLESVIHYAYTRKIDITTENAQKLLVASKRLQLVQVENVCIKFLSQRLNVKNVAQVCTFAVIHDNKKLIKNIKIFMRKNFEEFCKSDYFLDLSYLWFKEIISGDDLKLPKEETVFEAILNWVKFKTSERRDFLPELLSEVRMVHLPIPYLHSRAVSEELIRFSMPCRDLISRVLSYHLLPKEESRKLELKTQRRANNTYVLRHCRSLGYSVYSYDFINHTRNLIKPERLQFGIKVYGVAAGNDSIYLFSKKAIAKFHLDVNEWTILKTTDMGIKGAAIALHDKKLYCFGSNRNTFKRNVRCFDTRTDKWLRMYRMDTHVHDCAATSLDDSIYVTGGDVYHDSSINTAQKFIPSTGQWSTISPMLRARRMHGCTSMNGKIYVCGGSDRFTFVKEAEVFDPLINKWNFISSPFSSLHFLLGFRCSLIAQDNKIFALPRGYPYFWEVLGKDFAIYDTESGVWTIGYDVPSNFTAAVLI